MFDINNTIKIHVNGFELKYNIGDRVTIDHDTESPKKVYTVCQVNIKRDGSQLYMISNGSTNLWMVFSLWLPQ